MAYYVRKELESWHFVPTIANLASPTVAEIDAGDDITDDIRAVAGFTATTAFIDVPTMKGGRAPKITGGQTTEDSTLTMAEHNTFAANTIKAALAEGTSGYIVISPYVKTVAAAARVDVYPVTIGGNNRTHTVDDAPSEYTVNFGITADPELDATVAA